MSERGIPLDALIDEAKAKYGFSDEAWKMYSDTHAENQDLENEVSQLRDVARRSAVLVYWFSHEDVPFTELSAEQMNACNDDAEALHQALQRHGYYKDGWGS